MSKKIVILKKQMVALSVMIMLMFGLVHWSYRIDLKQQQQSLHKKYVTTSQALLKEQERVLREKYEQKLALADVSCRKKQGSK